MKRLRILLGCLAGLLALLALAAAAAFTPAVQTWAAHRALAGRRDVAVREVAVGLGRVSVRALRFERDGAVLDVPALDVDAAVLPAVLTRSVSIRGLTARGWTLDLTRLNPAALARLRGPATAAEAAPPDPLSPFGAAARAAEAPAAQAAGRIFQGLFRDLRLPVGLRLDGLDLDGTVVLPPLPGYPGAARMKVSVSGGGLGAGSSARFPFHLAVAHDGADSPVRALEVDGSVRASMDTPVTFDRLGLAASATASGPRVPSGARLRAELDGQRAAEGESYTLALSGASKRLADVRADFSYAAGRLAGTWKLDLCDDDLAPFALGRPLPIFLAQGEGGFETDATFASIKASGQVTAMADRLGAVLPAQAGAGAVKLTASFDAAARGGGLRVDRLDLALDGVHPILAARALQPFEFNPARGELKVVDPGRELLDLNLKGLPLAWIQPYLPGFRLSGSEIHGEVLAGARDGGLVLRPKYPMTIQGLTVTRDGRTVLDDCDLLVSASGDYTPAGWQLSVSPFIVRDQGRNFAEVELMVGRLAGAHQPVKVAGRLDANLPALLAQTGVAGLGALKDGGVSCEFSGSLAARSSFQARLRCTRLVVAADAKQPSRPLPDLSADLSAEQDETGRTTFGAPVVFQDGTAKSALTFSGSARKASSGLVFDARISSDGIDAGDLAGFVAGLQQGGSASSPAASAAPAATPAPAAEAPWSGLAGELALDVKNLRAPGFAASSLAGRLKLAPRSVSVDGLSAVLVGGGQVRVDGSLSLDPTAAEPWGLDGTVDVADFDSAPLFRELDPSRPPAVDGKFSLKGRVRGRAPVLGALADRASGEVELSSKGGAFRLLAAGALPTPSAPKASAFDAILGNVTGAVAAVTGRRDAADNVAAKLKVLAEVVSILSEIRYDQLTARAARDAAGNTVLSELALISPELRLRGGGRIDYRADTPLLSRPLSARFKLGARGRSADLLRQAGVLEEGRDELGYAGCTLPLAVGGSLEKPDTGELRAALLKAAYAKAVGGDLLDRLFGR